MKKLTSIIRSMTGIFSDKKWRYRSKKSCNFSQEKLSPQTNSMMLNLGRKHCSEEKLLNHLERKIEALLNPSHLKYKRLRRTRV